MFLYNQAVEETHIKQSEMLERAKQYELAKIAQSGQKRFQIWAWLLPILQRQPVITQPKVSSQCEVTRKTTSNPAW